MGEVDVGCNSEKSQRNGVGMFVKGGWAGQVQASGAGQRVEL